MTGSPFLFVVGCGRSGTTLLRAMLDGHSELAVPGESYFVVSMGKRWARGPFSIDRFVAELDNHPWFAQWRVPITHVQTALRDQGVTSFADAVRATYATFAASRGKGRYADKTPSYVLKLPFLAGLLPEARFLHLVRDGRDVALSLAASHFGPRSIGGCALYWRRHVLAGRSAGGRLEPGRYLEARYEDLVADPEPVLRAICSFADLTFDQAMLRYTERADQVLAQERTPSAHERVRLPPTPGLRDWHIQMRSADVALWEHLAGDALEAFGYERAQERVTPATRIRAILHCSVLALDDRAFRRRRQLRRMRPKTWADVGRPNHLA